MAATTTHRPNSTRQIIDEQLLEQRERLLEIAAFLDRLDRMPGETMTDHRLRAFRSALTVLCSDSGSRTTEILVRLSDPREGLVENSLDETAAAIIDPVAEGGR
jgi:hypothetical protein